MFASSYVLLKTLDLQLTGGLRFQKLVLALRISGMSLQCFIMLFKCRHLVD